jgi:hypothetical protein
LDLPRPEELFLMLSVEFHIGKHICLGVRKVSYCKSGKL